VTTVDFMKALADAKSASFEALPIGDYDIEIIKSDAVRSGNDKPMIKVQGRVLSGPYEKRQIFNNFVLSTDNPNAMAIFFRHMKCMGLDDSFFASMGQNGDMATVASALVGRRSRWTLGIRQWQGEDRNEVKGIKPYTGAPGAPAMTGPSANFGPPGGGPSTTFNPGGPTPATAYVTTPPPAPAPVAPPVSAPVTPPQPVAPPVAPPAPPVTVQPTPSAEAPQQTYVGEQAAEPYAPTVIQSPAPEHPQAPAEPAAPAAPTAPELPF